MSVAFIQCDGCGKQSTEVAAILQFKNNGGIAVHLCDECVDKAKDCLDRWKQENVTKGDGE